MVDEKIIFELGKITDKLKVKISLTLENDTGKFQVNSAKYFKYENVGYFKLSPRPLIAFDVILDNKGQTNFCLTKYLLASMIFELEEFLEIYKIEDLFYIDSSGNLTVSKMLQSQNERFINVCGEKKLCFTPAVVYVRDDGGTGQKEYEGCILYINHRDIYTYLTYTELRFLLYTLKKIDVDSWCLMLMNAYKLYVKDNPESLTENTITLTPESLPEGRGFLINQEPNTIPNLN